MRTLAALLVLLADDDVIARLDKGEVIVMSEEVKGNGIPRAIGEAVIEAPPEKIWPLIVDCDNYEKTMVRIAASKLISRDGGSMVCEVTANLPFPLPNLTSQTAVTLVEEPGVKYERTWKLISGDYRTNTGRWLLTPFKGDPKRTRARYELLIDPKIHVPDAFIAGGQKRTLPDLFEKLRSQAK